MSVNRATATTVDEPPKVAILDDYQDVALASADWTDLGPDARVTRFTDHVTDVDELAARLSGYTVLVVMRERTPITAELLDRLPQLRLITTTAMANAAIDVAAAQARGVLVCGTRRSNNATAELAWALIMAVAREIPLSDRDVRDGLWQQRIGIDLQGATLGVLGAGRLGSMVAAFGRAFGMRVLGWSPHLDGERAAEAGVELVGKEDLFRHSDIVSLHLRSSAGVRGIVGEDELRLLGSSGRLVNTSRGALVDETALVSALFEGMIAVAALDVYDVEPLPPDSPLLAAPNLILSPHVGFVTTGSHRLGYSQMLEDILAWMDGAPINIIDPG